ncbi:Ral GTPase-activating protein subunit alpha-1 [Smittium mucronatum]|uniref:Ral GTPase-activating protein subunit alpha-1 n=1 Tax=Smittium mucronatum TaxID=133383 RepID=A0A1R0H5V4_9FUNG|nr:Ral GTPase-activating protein subunit alpha-1 [Smittium mucronatum]
MPYSNKPNVEPSYSSLTQDPTFSQISIECSSLFSTPSHFPIDVLAPVSQNFSLKLQELLKSKRSSNSWFNERGKSATQFNNLLDFLAPLPDNELLYTFVRFHERIFEIIHKRFQDITSSIIDSSDVISPTFSPNIQMLISSIDLLRNLFFFIPQKLSQQWKQTEILSMLTSLIDYRNNQEIRIYGFRVLLIYMLSLGGNYSSEVIFLFKNSIILQSFKETDLFKISCHTSDVINSLNDDTFVPTVLDFEQSIIKSEYPKSVCPILSVDTDYYISAQGIIASRMLSDFFSTITFFSNFLYFQPSSPSTSSASKNDTSLMTEPDQASIKLPASQNDQNTSHLSQLSTQPSTSNLHNNVTETTPPPRNGYFTQRLDSIEFPDMSSIFLPSISKYPIKSINFISRFLLSNKSIDSSIKSLIDYFSSSYISFFIKPKDGKKSLGGVPIPLMKIFVSHLLKYVVPRDIVSNQIINKSPVPTIDQFDYQKSQIFQPLYSKTHSYTYPEVIRKYNQDLWVESNPTMQNFFESVIFGSLNISNAAVLCAGYKIETCLEIFNHVENTQLGALTIFNTFLQMDRLRKPSLFVKPTLPDQITKWQSIMKRYFHSVLHNVKMNVNLDELWNERRLSVFYFCLITFRSIYQLDKLEISPEILESCINDLLDSLKIILVRAPKQLEDTDSPYCLGTMAIVLLFETIIEGWLLVIEDKFSFHKKLLSIFKIDSPWNSRYQVWSNVLQALTMTLGTKMLKIDELELLQDYMFSGQIRKGGNRGLKNKLELYQYIQLIDIKNGKPLDDPFASLTPFILTSKCSLIASQLVLDFLANRKDVNISLFSTEIPLVPPKNLLKFSGYILPDELSNSFNRAKSFLNSDLQNKIFKNREQSKISPHQSSPNNLNPLLDGNSGLNNSPLPLNLNKPRVTSFKKSLNIPNTQSENLIPTYLSSNFTNNEPKSPLTSRSTNALVTAKPFPEYNSQSESPMNSPKRPPDSQSPDEHTSLTIPKKPQKSISLSLNNDTRSRVPTRISTSPKATYKKIRKKSISAIKNIVQFFHFEKSRDEKKKNQNLLSESESLSYSKEQYKKAIQHCFSSMNEWILLKTPFWKNFNLNEHVDWDSNDQSIKRIWSNWWSMVEKPVNVKNLEAKKIITMGLAKAWDIKLILADRQTASGVDSVTDDKLEFAPWLFELCRGPQDSDICSVLSLRAISRVFCRTFSPTYSIPPIYQALFYRVVLESLSEKALEFEYGLKCLEVTLTECNRIFALDVPGCFMVIDALSDSLSMIFSTNFQYKLSDSAIEGAANFLISVITLLGSSFHNIAENMTMCPRAIIVDGQESSIEWVEFNPEARLNQLCLLLFSLILNRKEILNNVSESSLSKITGNLISCLSIACFTYTKSISLAENATRLILGMAFDMDKNLALVAIDCLRSFLSRNSPSEVIDMLGYELILQICRKLTFVCIENIDRFVDTGEQNFAKIFCEALLLLMSYIIAVPDVILGKQSGLDINEHRNLESLVFNDLIKGTTDRIKSMSKLSKHQYNFNATLETHVGDTPMNLDNLVVNLIRTEFTKTSEYNEMCKSYDEKKAEQSSTWINNTIMVFTYHLMQYFDNHQSLNGIEHGMNELDNEFNDLDNIKDGDEILFFGFGDSVVSLIRSNDDDNVKITLRSVAGKFTGFIYSYLESSESPRIELEREEPAILKIIEDQLYVDNMFDINQFIPRKDPFKIETKSTKTLILSPTTSEHYDTFEYPKVRSINPLNIDWASYKAAANDSFTAENQRIEKLVSNTKDFVYSFKSKEQLALEKIVRQEPKMLSLASKKQETLFNEFRLIMQHFGLFDNIRGCPDSFRSLKPSQQLFRDMRLLDKISPKENIKVAICYVAPNQTTESEILSNNQNSTSMAYREFVRSLGWPVNLENFTGYIGKLNTDGTDGRIAPYFSTNYLELVFHDCTEMPTDPKDAKQLRKKRHIGNDFVHIIWNENFCDYRPETISGDFGNAQIHIRPLPSNLGSYGVSLYVDNRIDGIGPLVENMVLGPDLLSSIVRSWVISAHRQALWMRLPSYYHPYLKRLESINQIVKNHCSSGWSNTTYPNLFLVNPGTIARSNPTASESIQTVH